MSDTEDSAVPSPEERAEEAARLLEAERERRHAAEERAEEATTTMSRRDFLGAALGATGGAALGAFLGWGIGRSDDAGDVQVIQPPASGDAADMLVFYPRVKVASVSALETGVPVAFEYPLQGQTAELVKLGKPGKYGLGEDGDIVAFSTKCTHMGWPLGGTFKAEQCMWGPCPGHLSTFDATVGGQCALGQGTQNLPQIALVIDGDDIFAEGVLGLVYGYRDNLKDGTPVEASA